MLRGAARRFPALILALLPAAALTVVVFCSPAFAEEPAAEAGEESAPAYESIVENVDGVEFELIRIPGGTFSMGDEEGGRDEVPVHDVTVGDFYLAKYEVTQELFEKVVGGNPSSFTECPACPVEGTAHTVLQRDPKFEVKLDTVKFFAALKEKTGKTFRLPTEAEWEYAARGGRDNRWAGTDSEEELGDYGWYKDNSDGKTHPVGQKKPNPFGLYDMSGNVWEWCADWYKEKYYAESPNENPTGPKRGHAKVVKGGSWKNSYKSLRTSDRHRIDPAYFRLNLVGFRIAMDVETPAGEEAAGAEGTSAETDAAQ